VAKQASGKQSGRMTPGTTPEGAHRDPICGQRLAAPEGFYNADYKKRRYYFCSARCRDEFAVRTEKFKLVEQARAGTLFCLGKVRWGLS